MPNLQHNPDHERHLTLAALAHCPRDYWYTDRVRRGEMADRAPGGSLLVGILVHHGLEALWKQRQTEKTWTPSLALDAIDAVAGADIALAMLQDKTALVNESRKAVLDYAVQWTGARDHWKPVSVAPVDVPPASWTVLDGRFVAYPDLLVDAGSMYPLVVVDHKTSMWKFEAEKWEWHPELLTQCLAARQLRPDCPIFYQIDYLQRPGRRSNVWSFPATPVWEFTDTKAAAAQWWMEHLFGRRDDYINGDGDKPWPQELSQCQTPWGLCKWYGDCFGDGHATSQ